MIGILVSDTKTNNFWCIFEPLTGEMWYYFSSVGEVYAAQRLPAGRFYWELEGTKQTCKSVADAEAG